MCPGKGYMRTGPCFSQRGQLQQGKEMKRWEGVREVQEHTSALVPAST